MAKTFCTGIPRMKLAVENCCETHDKAYSRDAGTGTRYEADLALYHCLRTERPVFAMFAFSLVRIFGWLFWKRK